MAVRPRFGVLTLGEAQALLQGLHALNKLQLRQGVPPISRALRPDGWGRRRLAYIRRDPTERWLSLREIWQRGGGDCEDLAAATSAELDALYGIPAVPIITRVRPGLAHARVLRLDNGTILDPSLTGGMRGRG
ncbi:MAG: hypothetical protein H6739_07825 [Alphaproteobacteria bacterium]|nr:hypothetical protein [Alphaproteobacteria bacterium]